MTSIPHPTMEGWPRGTRRRTRHVCQGLCLSQLQPRGEEAGKRITTPPVRDEEGKLAPDYFIVNNGLLSLAARTQMSHSLLAPVVAWIARWNPWTWSIHGDGTGFYSPFLTGLLVIGLV